MIYLIKPYIIWIWYYIYIIKYHILYDFIGKNLAPAFCPQIVDFAAIIICLLHVQNCWSGEIPSLKHFWISCSRILSVIVVWSCFPSEHFENDVVNTAKSFLKFFPKISILIVSDELPYPPLQWDSPQVKVRFIIYMYPGNGSPYMISDLTFAVLSSICWWFGVDFLIRKGYKSIFFTC